MTVAQEKRVSAQVVANAFVQQYYHIQQHSPGLVHRFYQEESKLGRPEDDGTMSTTTTLQGINEKILSLNYDEYKAEITFVDAQESYNGAVHVLVSGYFERKDNMTITNFTQTFVLAPQEKGYFVLNDLLRYISHSSENQNSTTDLGAPLSPKQDLLPVQEIHVPEETKVSIEVNREEACKASDNGEVSFGEEDDGGGSNVDEDDGEIPFVEEVSVPEVIDEVPDDSQFVVELKSKIEEVPKKTYASIVMDLKESVVQLSSPSPAPQLSVPKSQEQQVNFVEASASVAETPISGPDAIEDGKNQEEEAEGYSVYVKGLPFDATPALLEDEFKRFGAIKSGGIQVRCNQDGFCFGFVEFEVETAAQRAIEASPLSIGGRRAIVEEKRSTCSRVNGYRGRYPIVRGFRQDGNYGNFRGNTRGDFNVRTENGSFRVGYRGGFSSRGGYQRADNMGSNGGRMNRGGGMATNGTGKTVAPQLSATA